MQPSKKIFLSKLVIIGCFVFPISAFGQWQMVSTEDTLFSYRDVTITSDSTVFVCGSTYNSGGVILKSVDFGMTWTTYTFPHACMDISFPTNSVGYAIVLPSSVYKTIDGGNTWSLIVDTLNINKPRRDILFINADTGFVSAQDNWASFYRTTDGGISWQQIVDSSLGSGLQLIGGRYIVFNDGNLYVTGGGFFLKSSNFGDNWMPYLNNSIYNTNFTVAAQNDTIWMAGQGANGSPHYNYGIISRSTDGGINWSVLQFQEFNSFLDIEMVNSLRGYLVGDFYDSIFAFLKTINGGISWSPQQWIGNNPYGFGLKAIHCLNDSTCFAVGSNATIFRITNSGGQVNAIPELTNESLVFFPNPIIDKLNIETTNNELSEFFLYDMTSRKILQQQFINSLTLNVKQLAKGIYIYEVRNKNGLCKKGKVVKD